MVVPQFIYLFRSLPTPSQSKDVLNNYERGWLKLLNLEALCFSLKASFIQKLYFIEDWYSCKLLESALLLFQKWLYTFLQIQPAHIHCVNNLVGNISIFLKEAIQCWLCFQFYPPENRYEILQQIIWLNSNILIGGKPIFWKNTFDLGVCNTILCVIMGNLCSIHSYNQLISALRRDLKHKFNSGWLSCQYANLLQEI